MSESLKTERAVPNAFPIVPLVFQQDAIAASQTNVQLPVAHVGGTLTGCVAGYTMPWPGTIVGIAADVSAAATAGTLTVGPTVDGTEAGDPTLSITTETSKSDTAPRSSSGATFTAGQVIGAEITSSSGWDATTSDLLVTVWVMLEVTGI